MLSIGRCVGGSLSASKNGQVSRAIAISVLRCAPVNSQFCPWWSPWQLDCPVSPGPAAAAGDAKAAASKTIDRSTPKTRVRTMRDSSLTLEAGCRDALLHEALQEQEN